MKQGAISGQAMLEHLMEVDPADVVQEVVDVPFVVQGVTVMMVHASCHCGGSYAWMHLRDTGAWEMKGCVCHNPAVGP